MVVEEGEVVEAVAGVEVVAERERTEHVERTVPSRVKP